jgi:heat shock protein HslJ
MKRIVTAALIACITAAIIIAGCTSIPSTAPATTIATPVVTANPTSVPVPITDPMLQGNWYLKQMGEQGGAAPILVTNVQINIMFDNAGNFQGSTGCNNYNGQYTLTGKQMFSGMGMTIGPIASSGKYCADNANTESVYFQILQKTNSYVVNSNGELTLTDTTNSNLVYTKNPAAPPVPSY